MESFVSTRKSVCTKIHWSAGVRKVLGMFYRKPSSFQASCDSQCIPDIQGLRYITDNESMEKTYTE